MSGHTQRGPQLIHKAQIVSVAPCTCFSIQGFAKMCILVNNGRMVVSSPRYQPGSRQDFGLDRQSYQAPAEPIIIRLRSQCYCVRSMGQEGDETMRSRSFTALQPALNLNYHWNILRNKPEHLYSYCKACCVVAHALHLLSVVL